MNPGERSQANSGRPAEAKAPPGAVPSTVPARYDRDDPATRNALAAYCDGRTRAADRDRVERTLAASPEAVADLRFLREMAACEYGPVPDWMEERARALVPPSPASRTGDRPAAAGRIRARRGSMSGATGARPLGRRRWRAGPGLGLAVGCALILGVCAGGYRLGAGTQRAWMAIDRMLLADLAIDFEVDALPMPPGGAP